MSKFVNDPVDSNNNNTDAPAILGVSSTKHGVGVRGHSTFQSGVVGESEQLDGVLGVTTSEGHAGVAGVSNDGNGNGVYGYSKNVDGVVGLSEAAGHNGVLGTNDNGTGVYGHSNLGAGVFGDSNQFDGVHGVSRANGHSGVTGVNDVGDGFGVYASCKNGIGIISTGSRLAGRFEGDIEVTGDIRLINADCAEDFDISGAATAEPGTVMVLGEEGALFPSQKPYDKRVAGVISGAGDYKPGLILDQQAAKGNRQPVALLGKVFCKVDAQFGSIEVGDLLTTSPTPGHAMRAHDPLKAFGAVIGKALRPLENGQALIPILIALQ